MFWKRKEPSLMKQVCEIENLVDAWRKVKSNVRVANRKHSQGVDMVSLEEFEANWKENMADLAMSLEDGAYLPMPLKRVKLRKKDNGYRTICILSVQDRIAQRAVLNVLEPIFEEIFPRLQLRLPPWPLGAGCDRTHHRMQSTGLHLGGGCRHQIVLRFR